MIHILNSKRLYARIFTMEDFDNLYNLHANPKVAKNTIDGIQDFNTIKKHLNDFISHQEKYGYSQWAVFEKESGYFIGRGGLTSRVLSKNIGEEMEIRFALLPEFWGKGYASELAFAIKEYASKTLKAKRIVASSNPKNDASNHILKKIGFTFIKNIIPQGYGVKQEVTYNELEL